MIEQQLDRIMDRYDPERDFDRNGAPVPWYVQILVDVCRDQEHSIEGLRNQIDALDAQINGEK